MWFHYSDETNPFTLDFRKKGGEALQKALKLIHPFLENCKLLDVIFDQLEEKKGKCRLPYPTWGKLDWKLVVHPITSQTEMYPIDKDLLNALSTRLQVQDVMSFPKLYGLVLRFINLSDYPVHGEIVEFPPGDALRAALRVASLSLQQLPFLLKNFLLLDPCPLCIVNVILNKK